MRLVDLTDPVLSVAAFFEERDFLALERSAPRFRDVLTDDGSTVNDIWRNLCRRRWPWIDDRAAWTEAFAGWRRVHAYLTGVAFVAYQSKVRDDAEEYDVPRLPSLRVGWSDAGTGPSETPLAIVDECAYSEEPLLLDSPPIGESAWVDVYSITHLRPGFPRRRAGRDASSDAVTWDADLEIGAAGWHGFLLGVVAADPSERRLLWGCPVCCAEAVAESRDGYDYCDCDDSLICYNSWFFDFGNGNYGYERNRVGITIDGWWTAEPAAGPHWAVDSIEDTDSPRTLRLSVDRRAGELTVDFIEPSPEPRVLGILRDPGLAAVEGPLSVFVAFSGVHVDDAELDSKRSFARLHRLQPRRPRAH